MNGEINMRITYIEHSGFLVDMGDMYLLFDYYKGNIPETYGDKPMAVFASHNHSDHYNSEIFSLGKKHKDIRYILSSDIPVKGKNKVYSASPDEIFNVEFDNGKTINVETFKSTDEGVAFLVEFDGKKIYHAGDLNVWAWYEEGMDYVLSQRKEFAEYTKNLAGRKVDIAFVLIDPRLEEGGFEGPDAYRKLMDADVIVPMHQWDRYEFTDEYKKNRENTDNILRIEYRGQSFEI